MTAHPQDNNERKGLFELKDKVTMIVYAHVDLRDNEHEVEANIAIEELVALIMEETEGLENDLAVAMAHMQGCGHEYPYLTRKYPQYASPNTPEETE